MAFRDPYRVRIIGGYGFFGQRLAQMGLARLAFALEVNGGRLRTRLAGLRFLGIPCPAWLRPRLVAEEAGNRPAGRDRLHFRIEARVPGLGQVVGYRGHPWLPDDPVVEAARARG